MKKQKSYVLVINLKSRQAAQAIDTVKDALAETNTTIKVLEVKDPANITKYFQKAIDAKPDVIVLGGGDGTLISGVEYLSKNDYKKEIGLLPLGTANYLARNLNIPLDIQGSIETLLTGKVREIPVAAANGKYFALTFVVGLTQAVAHNVSDDIKKKLGQGAYVVELLKQTKLHEPFNYTIESPDIKKAIKGVSHQIIVYNSDINQQVKLVPDHDLEKPTVKVVISRSGESKLKLILSFLAHILTLGKLRPYMRVLEVQSLKISTQPILPGDFDGENYGTSPFTIETIKRKIKVIC